jgi:hypothetical protein
MIHSQDKEQLVMSNWIRIHDYRIFIRDKKSFFFF